MRSARVLAIQVERGAREDLRRRLKRLGYDALSVASSGAEAMRLVEHERPSLVLIDIHVDGPVEGIAIGREILERFDVPLVYLSESASPELSRTVNQSGLFPGALKPVEDPDLRTIIETVLSNQVTERRLREAERWLSATLHSIGDGIVAADENLCVKFLNGVAEDLTGWTNAEAVGRNLLEVFPFESEQMPMRPGAQSENREMRLTAKGGKETLVSYRLFPAPGEHSQFAGVVLVFRDITECEEANRQSRQQAERLATAEQQLLQAQKMEALGHLTGGVAHDFNNLLTVIAGYNSMMMEEKLTPELDSAAREIRVAVERASALTRQLLDFSRHKLRSPSQLDLNEVVRNIEKMLRRVIGEDILLATALTSSHVNVHADAGEMDQVILNLAVNARDAMSHGGTLTIETSVVGIGSESKGCYSGQLPGEHVMLAIVDTGSGMTLDVQKRMFEPFYTTKEAEKGTGLGLAIVHSIVRQSGGQISVVSEPGRGTRIQIFLPLMQERETAPAKAADLGPADRGTETILIAEDEEPVRRLVSNTLRRQGYHVIEAATPEDAMRLTAEYSGQIDLLLTDVVMPNTNGVELARALRESRRGLKILYMSGYTENAVSKMDAAEILSCHIAKPFSADSLKRKVREALAGDIGNRSKTSNHHA